MKHPVTRIEIEAGAYAVWDVLTDFPRYPEWNPAVAFLDEVREGARVRMRVTLFGRTLTVPVRIEALRAREELRWRGGPGWLMHGTHYFRIAPIGPGRTELVHGERFGGVALPLLWPVLAPELTRFYERINVALARRCASTSAAPGETLG